MAAVPQQRQRIDDRQKTVLIDYMTEHSFFAKHGFGPGPQGKELGERMWSTLATRLNACGKAQKNVSGWKQSWADMKSRVKKAAATVYHTPTGNGSQEEEFGVAPQTLSAEDEKIYKLCGGPDFIGSGPDDEIGIRKAPLQHASVEVPEEQPEVFEIPETYVEGDEQTMEEESFDHLDLPQGVTYDINLPAISVEELEEMATSYGKELTAPHKVTTSKIGNSVAAPRVLFSNAIPRMPANLNSHLRMPTAPILLHSKKTCSRPLNPLPRMSLHSKKDLVKDKENSPEGDTEKVSGKVATNRGAGKENSVSPPSAGKNKNKENSTEGDTEKVSGKVATKRPAGKENSVSPASAGKNKKPLRMHDAYIESSKMFTHGLDEMRRTKEDNVSAIKELTEAARNLTNAVLKLTEVGEKFVSFLSADGNNNNCED